MPSPQFSHTEGLINQEAKMEASQSSPVGPRDALDQEARIRSALGLECGPLPALGRVWLRKYYEYMASHLFLPFEARCAENTGSFREPTDPATVLDILDPLRHPSEDDAGLVCRVRRGPQEEHVPLVDLEVDEDHPNYQLLEDYWYWVWNWRFDPQI
jgi:hypothetical protein